MTSFYIPDPPTPPEGRKEHWLAIATAHVFDEDVDTKGALSPAQSILAGAVARSIEGRASATTECSAMQAAVKALLFQLEALEEMRGRSLRE